MLILVGLFIISFGVALVKSVTLRSNYTKTWNTSRAISDTTSKATGYVDNGNYGMKPQTLGPEPIIILERQPIIQHYSTKVIKEKEDNRCGGCGSVRRGGHCNYCGN
jgi:hypothetical protein